MRCLLLMVTLAPYRPYVVHCLFLVRLLSTTTNYVFPSLVVLLATFRVAKHENALQTVRGGNENALQSQRISLGLRLQPR